MRSVLNRQRRTQLEGTGASHHAGFGVHAIVMCGVNNRDGVIFADLLQIRWSDWPESKLKQCIPDFDHTE